MFIIYHIYILKYSVDVDTQFIWPHNTTPRRKKNSGMVWRNSMKENVTYSSMSCAEDRLDVKVWVLSKDKSALTRWQRENTGALYHLWHISSEHLLASLYGMAKQGRFLGWEAAMQMDTGWNRILYSWSPEMLKFYLSAIQYPAFTCQL